MNIIHITDSHEFSGGVVQIKLLMEGLRDRGIKQMIVCPSGGTVAGTFQQAGFRVHTLDMFQDYDVIAAWRLAKLIRQEKPDLVHAHHPTAHAVTLVAAHFIRFRLVVSRRVTHRIKPFPTSRWKYGSKKISRFICVSDAVRRELRRSGVSGERLAVVGSSTNLERFSPRPPSQRVLNELEKIGEVAVPNGNRPPLIAVIANYSSWKGQDLFLEAFARVPAGPMAVLAGRDTDGPAMRERVRELGLEPRAHCLGWRVDVEEILSVSKVLVCPSLKGEGSSGAIREAFAMNIPVIASDIDANRELVSTERGWLFKNGDAADLARVVESFLRADPQEIKSKTDSAHQFVHEHFSVKAMVEGTLHIYREAVGSHAPSLV